VFAPRQRQQLAGQLEELLLLAVAQVAALQPRVFVALVAAQ
jgi:hypothetical protein